MPRAPAPPSHLSTCGGRLTARWGRRRVGRWAQGDVGVAAAARSRGSHCSCSWSLPPPPPAGTQLLPQPQHHHHCPGALASCSASPQPSARQQHPALERSGGGGAAGATQFPPPASPAVDCVCGVAASARRKRHLLLGETREVHWGRGSCMAIVERHRGCRRRHSGAGWRRIKEQAGSDVAQWGVRGVGGMRSAAVGERESRAGEGGANARGHDSAASNRGVGGRQDAADGRGGA